MKLIDCLLEVLPSQGGWKAGADFVAVSFGEAKFYSNRHGALSTIEGVEDGMEGERVSREKYEMAIAKSQQPHWNGEGLPPVGTECQVKSSPEGWTLCKVVYSTGEGVAFVYLEEPEPVSATSSYVGSLDSIGKTNCASYFRPTRNEAERKREEVGVAIFYAINWNHQDGPVSESRMEGYRKAYDAIAAGKIPHVTLK